MSRTNPPFPFLTSDLSQLRELPKPAEPSHTHALTPFEAKLQQAIEARNPQTGELDEAYVRSHITIFRNLLRTARTAEDKARFQTALTAWQACLPASKYL